MKEGCGIWNTARLMGIAKGTVLRRIKIIAARLEPPTNFDEGLDYEMDELHTCIGGKHTETYLCYAIERKTRAVLDFVVGPRSKKVVGKLTAKLKKLKPMKVYTDGLNVYPGLLDAKIHIPGKFGTLRIERKNLSLRTNLKWLQRKTICFSRFLVMLNACLSIWFWG